MKISDKFKKVEYYGLTVLVNKNHNFLAVDSDGCLNSYSDEPELSNSNTFEYWQPVNAAFEWVAEVDLEGLNWQETLVELK